MKQQSWEKNFSDQYPEMTISGLNSETILKIGEPHWQSYGKKLDVPFLSHTVYRLVVRRNRNDISKRNQAFSMSSISNKTVELISNMSRR